MDLAPFTLERVEPGQNLLEIALSHGIDLFHQCGGVCHCTVCHLYVEEGMDSFDEVAQCEEDYIEKAINPRPSSRLACQASLLAGDGDITITIPDQRSMAAVVTR